jgi:hypothetical protein
MKRTNLVLDVSLLEKAKALLGLKTYSDTVNTALEELIRRKTFERIDLYASSDIWDGDLSAMRGDAVVPD